MSTITVRRGMHGNSFGRVSLPVLAAVVMLAVLPLNVAAFNSNTPPFRIHLPPDYRAVGIRDSIVVRLPDRRKASVFPEEISSYAMKTTRPVKGIPPHHLGQQETVAQSSDV